MIIGEAMKNKKRILVIALVFLFVFTVISFIGVGISIYQYADVDETQPADAAIILGAAVENDAPSPVFRERIRNGVSLYQNGYVTCLIFTGGIGDGDSISEAQAGKNYAMALGVPEHAIRIEENSHITEENMKYAKMIMEEQGMDTALIVSDPLHMKRAMKIAKDYGISAYSSPTRTSMYKTAKTQLPFLARETVMYIGYCFVSIFR